MTDARPTTDARPPSGAGRRRAPQARRDEILHAAERVLLERGLRATTVADVAESAGVAKGTMYLYFDSKDALIAGLRARYLDNFAQAMSAETGASATDRLRTLVTGLFTFASQNHALHHVLFRESGFSEEDAFTSVRVTLAGIIADGVAAGEMSTPDPEVAAAFILHGVHGSMVDILHNGPEGSRMRRIPGQLADLAERAVSVHGSSPRAELTGGRPAVDRTPAPSQRRARS